MAPLKPVKKDANEERVRTVLHFAKKISDILKDRNPITPALEEEFALTIKRSFPVPSTTAIAGKLSTFDSCGCELWNAATNIIREEEHQRDQQRHDNTRFIVLLRVFAFLLIDTTFHGSSKHAKDPNQRLRNFKIGLKAGRFCLQKDELDLALGLLERCSEHVSANGDDSPLVRISDRNDASDHITSMRELEAEFYLLRLTHAWKSDRLDLADHFFNKYCVSSVSSMDLAEKAADLFYEVGKPLAKKRLAETANKWLERALDALNACNMDSVSLDTGELRLCITSTFVDSLLASGARLSVKRAQGLVHDLCTTHGLGNRLTVQLMQIQILLADDLVATERLFDVISRLLRSAVLTEETFKIIMKAVRLVRRASPEVACHALKELITSRLLPDLPTDQEPANFVHDCIEKACVTYILFTTSDQGTISVSTFDGLQTALNAIAQRSNHGFSAKATHAAQTLIWKVTGSASGDVADRWCAILRHPLFESAGQMNKARIGRKAMTFAIARGDTDAAREVFFQMPHAAQNESLTRYLTFKLALRSNDYELAIESLNMVAKHSKEDNSFLYACVLEAQQCEKRPIAVVALQAIIDKQPREIHLPALLRCTARLLIQELDTSKGYPERVMDEVVRIFEHAVRNMQALKTGSTDQWESEVQWWSKNAYNLSLRHCAAVHPEQLVRLLTVCTSFIDEYPNDTRRQDSLQDRKALSHFLSAGALIVLGRSNQEGSEYSLQCYLQARREIASFKSLQQRICDQDQNGMRERMLELLKFDLESILSLQQWDQLDESLQHCLEFNHTDRWDTIADIVLIIHQQTSAAGFDDRTNERITELLQRIVNDTWRKAKDVHKAARWLRLSFHIHLTEGSSDFALKYLDQAAGIAKEGYNGTADLFPQTELQWLATTAFNKAVDLLSSGLEDVSERWTTAALELSRYAADDGALHSNLTSKRHLAVERMSHSVP